MTDILEKDLLYKQRGANSSGKHQQNLPQHWNIIYYYFLKQLPKFWIN